MAEFRAVVPHANYDETATIPDAAWAEVVISARARFGQVPEVTLGAIIETPAGDPVLDENGEPMREPSTTVMRDMTEVEVIKRILGSMLQGWLQNAALDKAERDRAAIQVQPADWVVT